MMKAQHLVVLLLVTIFFGASAATVKKTYKYVCHNESCKAYKQVVTFEENNRYEHKCSSCGKTLSPAD